jgi:hypothetical protein
MLALAHHIEAMIEAGELKDYAEAASALGVTRARLSQLMSLLLLAPSLQEEVLLNGRPTPARVLRRAATVASWDEQVEIIQRATRHKPA